MKDTAYRDDGTQNNTVSGCGVASKGEVVAIAVGMYDVTRLEPYISFFVFFGLVYRVTYNYVGSMLFKYLGHLLVCAFPIVLHLAVELFLKNIAGVKESVWRSSSVYLDVLRYPGGRNDLWF